jgi:putative tributyrin esterase
MAKSRIIEIDGAKMLRTFALFLIGAFGLFKVEAQEMVIIDSPNLHTRDTVLMVIPNKAPTDGTFPILFMLHGFGGSYRDYWNMLPLQELANRYGWIIACPDALKNTFYLNDPKPGGKQYETFFFDELMPNLFQRFPVDKNRVLITGISMGGHGALWLFLKRPERFFSAGSVSGVLQLKASGNRDGSLSQLLGPYSLNSYRFDSCSVVSNIEKIKDKGYYIIFDCGTEDYLYNANNSMRKRCDELGIKAMYITSPGKHEGSYFKKAIMQHFTFFDELLHQAKNDTSTSKQ